MLETAFMPHPIAYFSLNYILFYMFAIVMSKNIKINKIVITQVTITEQIFNIVD